jgi:hypothetical protein
MGAHACGRRKECSRPRRVDRAPIARPTGKKLVRRIARLDRRARVAAREERRLAGQLERTHQGRVRLEARLLALRGSVASLPTAIPEAVAGEPLPAPVVASGPEIETPEPRLAEAATTAPEPVTAEPPAEDVDEGGSATS